MSFSQFGDKFTQHSGISRLMEDMGAGLRTPGTIMLGGGNPAQIPAMNDYFQQLLQQMHEEGKLSEALCNYDGPRGKATLLASLALLQPVKGSVVGLQWAFRMHGFGDEEPEPVAGD